MNDSKEILQRWQKPGDVTSVPKLWYGRGNFINLNQNTNSRFIQPGDFIRLDNLQIGYTINSSLVKRLSKNNIRSIHAFAQGQNLILITKYKGLDPENIGEQGTDYNAIPSVRTFSFGFNIGF
jgi:hypothetical protein